MSGSDKPPRYSGVSPDHANSQRSDLPRHTSTPARVPPAAQRRSELPRSRQASTALLQARLEPVNATCSRLARTCARRRFAKNAKAGLVASAIPASLRRQRTHRTRMPLASTLLVPVTASWESWPRKHAAAIEPNYDRAHGLLANIQKDLHSRPPLAARGPRAIE